MKLWGGRGRGLTEVLYQHSLEETEENHTKPRQDEVLRAAVMKSSVY